MGPLAGSGFNWLRFSTRWLVPGIKNRNPGSFEISRVAGHHGKTIMKRRRGDDQIRLGLGMRGFPTILDQQPPFEHDVFADRQDAFLEHRPRFVG
jgi:hypothetical protein